MKNKLIIIFIILIIASNFNFAASENETSTIQEDEVRIENESERIGEEMATKKNNYLNIIPDNKYYIDNEIGGTKSRDSFTVKNLNELHPQNTSPEKLGSNENKTQKTSENISIKENTDTAISNATAKTDENKSIEKTLNPNEKENTEIVLSKHATGFDLKIIGIIIVIIGFILLAKYIRD